jgi:PAS domain-containing protein
MEANLKLKNGEKMPYHFEGHRFEDSGKLLFLGVGIDISERIEVDKALRELTEFNESIVNNLKEGIAVKDDQGKLIFANQAGLDMSGVRHSIYGIT